MTRSTIMTDWLSFTAPIDAPDGSPLWKMREHINDALFLLMGKAWVALIEDGVEFVPARGRPPYSHSEKSERGITIFHNPKLDNVLVEISGRGCEYLRKLGILRSTVECVHQRVTRIDLAVDLETDTRPKEFETDAVSGRHKSRSHIVSSDGETVYLGSMKSERYCRVYRYDGNHPRADFLRCEFVFRKRNAKQLIDQLVSSDWNMKSVALGCGNIYGFEHKAWDLSGDAIPIESYTPERGSGKTLYWLVGSVAPAFKKLVKQGVIDDPEKFLKEYFLNE